MIVIPDNAAVALIADLLGDVTTVYHLFTNDVTITQATALGDFIEANWPDYKPATVTSWTPALTVNGRAVAQADPTAWTRGVGGTAKMVYGYYVTDTVGGPLIWAEVRPQGPLRMQFPSDQVMILPQLTLRADSA